MDSKESIIFWEDAMGYLYVRYGNQLLKKFSSSDKIISKVRNSIIKREISIGSAIKRLCREWPILYGTSEKEITSDLKKLFDYNRRRKSLKTEGDSLKN